MEFVLNFFLKFTEYAKTVNQNTGGNLIIRIKHFSDLLAETASDMMKKPEFQELLKEEFDLVIIGYFFVDFTLGLGNHFNCPTVVLFSGTTIKAIDDYVGNVSPLASVPHAMIAKKEPMTFFNRVCNVLIYGLESAYLVYIRSVQNQYYRYVTFTVIHMLLKTYY